MENSGKVLIEREKFLHQGGAGFPLFFHRKEQGLVGNVGDFSTSTEIVWKMRKTSRFPKRSFRPPFPKGGGVQRRRLCRVRAEPAIANVPQERGPMVEIVPPTSAPLNAVPHSPVVSLPRTVRALLSAFFKKSGRKKHGGEPDRLTVCGMYSPDLPGASVHHP